MDLISMVQKLKLRWLRGIGNTSMHLMPHIVIGEYNFVFNSEWDNFNKMITYLTGSNVGNKAARNMLQEVKHGLQHPGAHTLPEYERDTKNNKTK